MNSRATPPETYCPTPPNEREAYQTYSMRYRCPCCGADLELLDRETWGRNCPDCYYVWLPPKQDITEDLSISLS